MTERKWCLSIADQSAHGLTSPLPATIDVLRPPMEVPPPDSNKIPDFVIEGNGPLDKCLVDIPLDNPVITNELRGIWATWPDLCTSARTASQADPTHMPDNALLIADKELIGRTLLAFEKVQVRLPLTFTTLILESGCPAKTKGSSDPEHRHGGYPRHGTSRKLAPRSAATLSQGVAEIEASSRMWPSPLRWSHI